MPVMGADWPVLAFCESVAAILDSEKAERSRTWCGLDLSSAVDVTTVETIASEEAELAEGRGRCRVHRRLPWWNVWEARMTASAPSRCQSVGVAVFGRRWPSWWPLRWRRDDLLTAVSGRRPLDCAVLGRAVSMTVGLAAWVSVASVRGMSVERAVALDIVLE